MSNTYITPSNTGYPSSLKEIKLTQEHEQIITAAKNTHELALKESDHLHELKKIDKILGQIGRFFGGEEHASRNITATICLSLIFGATIVSVIVYFGEKDILFIKSIWISIIPVISLSLGYLFGKK